MFKRLVGLLALAGVLLALLPLNRAVAERGTPGSSEFGYGAHLDLDGQFVSDAVQLANNLQLDWIALELPWSKLQPAKDQAVDWNDLDPIFKQLSQYNISVMVSLTQAPDWALTKNGPDAALTAKFVQQFTQRYPAGVSAVELFPAANTRQGWGADPNPSAYVSVWKAVNKVLASTKSRPLLVAGGLVPAGAGVDGQQDDLEYLQGLYNTGAKDLFGVISLQLNGLSGAPSASSDQSGQPVLRHYEEIRAVMIRNQHDSGLIWITQLNAPSELSDENELPSQTESKRTAWLSQALSQLRAQLYVGAAFYSQLNPPKHQSTTTAVDSLITRTGDLDSAYRVLRDQIALNSSGGMDPRPGRPKSETLVKGP